MIRKILIAVVSLTPFNRLRIFLYNTFFDYRITYNSVVGIGNFIDCNTCEIDGGFIGNFNYINCDKFIMANESSVVRFNKFLYVNIAILGENSNVQVRNTFVGNYPGTSPFKEHENIYIGAKSIVTRRHTFDLSDTISIGEDVTFAGNGIEVWTHGFDINHVKIQGGISIGNSGYIGSRSIISLGVKIADRVLIGAGTVVAKSIDQSGFYVSSQLIRKSDVQSLQDHEGVIEFNGARFFKK